MKNALNSVKISKPTTASFDLSHDVKLSFNMGKLIPVLAMECLPGDRIRINCENLIRLAPMVAPIMHRNDVRVEYFFVPNRLVWENWETWITNGGSEPIQENPLPAFPYIQYNADGTGGVLAYTPLMDYMGLPMPGQGLNQDWPEKVSAIPFGAYAKIYDDYYRDQNLVDTISDGYPCIDGNNNAHVNIDIQNRAWEADYFTKSLPFAQKGSPVDLPLAEFDDVRVRVNQANTPGGVASIANTFTPNPLQIAGDTPTFGADAGEDLFAETSQMGATAATINDLRLAFRLQEWLEKNARGGTRYSEIIRAHFNVSPEDSRMQRPEYIVGVKNPIQISEVLNTTGTAEAAQGNMAGHGVQYAKGNYGKFFCPEHGYIIGIMSVMPKTAYQQGIPKHFLKYTDPTEHAWPTFANLGEQPILNKEIFAFQNSDGDETFGYTPRFMEYKNLPSRVAGEFRTTLNFWHQARIFAPDAPPSLNKTFIEADPTKRIFAVEGVGEDEVYAHVQHNIVAVRALPFYGTPTF